jgi:RNA polymerase sigma-70 factor, ECF subfamily
MPIATSPELCEELLQLARAGCNDAFGKLLNAFRPYLLSMANEELDVELRAKGGASDLVQETFLDAHQCFKRFRGAGPDELLAWLRQILLNNSGNFRRHFLEVDKRSVRREIELKLLLAMRTEGYEQMKTSEPPEALLMKLERFRQLEQALNQLQPDHRTLVVWRNFERLSFRVIAERLSITESAAQKRWMTAVCVLRERLNGLNP